MTRYWKRLGEWITPGVGWLLGVLTAVYLGAIIGRVTGTFDLYRWLALDAGEFWHGRIWTVVSYCLLPAGLADFVLNGFVLAWVGGIVERVCSRRELWLYALIATAGTGLAKALLTPSSPWLLVGTSGMVFGLLAALWRLIGHERVVMLGLGQMSMRSAVLIIGGVILVAMLPCAGPVNTLIALSGGVAGWLYLTVRFRLQRAQAARTVANERLRKLEI